MPSVCFVSYYSAPLLFPGSGGKMVGGAEVQQHHLARALRARGPFPDNVSSATVDRQDDEPMDVSRLNVTPGLMGRDALSAHRDGGQQEQPIAPHYR